jgi:hypothetical protein
MAGFTKFVLSLVCLCLVVGHSIADVITPIQDQNARNITIGDTETQVTVSINNTIPNAMIWVQ